MNNNFTNTFIISSKTGVQHISVIKLINSNKNQFEELGEISSMQMNIKKSQRKSKVYFLNKQQTILLLHKMSRRTDIENSVLFLGLEKEFKVVGKRLEHKFYELLKSIINGLNLGTSNDIKIEKQFPIKGYLIDFAIMQKIGDKYEISLLIEYDEFRHKYILEKDLLRQKQIINELKKENNGYNIAFCRVNEKEELNALTEIIAYLQKDLILETYDNVSLKYINTYDLL